MFAHSNLLILLIPLSAAARTGFRDSEQLRPLDASTVARHSPADLLSSLGLLSASRLRLSLLLAQHRLFFVSGFLCRLLCPNIGLTYY